MLASSADGPSGGKCASSRSRSNSSSSSQRRALKGNPLKMMTFLFTFHCLLKSRCSWGSSSFPATCSYRSPRSCLALRRQRNSSSIVRTQFASAPTSLLLLQTSDPGSTQRQPMTPCSQPKYSRPMPPATLTNTHSPLILPPITHLMCALCALQSLSTPRQQVHHLPPCPLLKVTPWN